jgi:hypothetical protein
MELKVEHDPKSNVCTIKVSGEHKRPQDSQKLFKIAGASAIEHKCSRFLFDMREATIIGRMYESYETVATAEQFGISRLFRIAAVYPVIIKEHEFMAEVGKNRGATAFRVFDDIDLARQWIEEE